MSSVESVENTGFMQKTIKGPDGNDLTGDVIPVTESTEKYTELRLEDGAVLRVKATASEALRVVDQADRDGNPMYYAKLITVIDLIRPGDPTE